MRTNNRRVPTRFGPETRFEVRPLPPAPFRALLEDEFERLKGELLEATDADGNARRAANEAAALAWVTRYPLLVFPVLFEEKLDGERARAARQEVIRQRSRELLAV